MIKNLISLKNRHVLITGGSGFLGQKIINALLELGANICSVDLKSNLSKANSKRVKFIPVDLEDEKAVRRLPEQACPKEDHLDILIHCAAFVGTNKLPGWSTSFESQTSNTWRKALEVNLTSVFNLTQAALPFLRKSQQASIINIASIYGLCGPDWKLYKGTNMGNPAAYAASKGALIQFTRWCATTLAPIRVNTVTPGGIFRNQPDSFVEKYINKVPLKRMATEEDIVGAIVYFASDLSNYVTGHNLIVDGGFSVW